jgi:tetratricopeptide (TPR) repeat protein
VTGRTFPAFVLAACLLAAPPIAAAPDAEVAALLERAQFWQVRQRDDRAREEIDKALRLVPDQPDALVMLARMQLKANQEREATATFERLRRAHPTHPGVAKLSASLRVLGPDRERLRQARALGRAGRNEQAAAAYRAIFPDGPPDDDLALEYASVLAWTDDGWEPARAIFADLARRNPQDARFQVALVSHVSTRKPVSAETLKSLRELGAHPSDAVSRTARDAYRRALLAMDAAPANLPALREYVAANPTDSAVKDRLDAMAQEIANPKPKAGAADPATRARTEGWTAFGANRIEEAEAKFSEAIALAPRDAEAVGGLGLVRQRQDRAAEAIELFERAASLDKAGRAKWEGFANGVRYWQRLSESRQARAAGNLALAEAKAREARALDPSGADAAVELAKVHVAAGRDRDAEALAAELPAGQRAAITESIGELRATRARGDADKLVAQGRQAEAIALLEGAATLDRNNPWVRHDLARLYAARGEAARGHALFDELIARRPRDADARYARALFLSSIAEEGAALEVLEAIPAADRSANMTRLQRRLWMSVQGGRADALARAGRKPESDAVIASMLEAIGNDRDMAIEAGRALQRMQAEAELRALLDRVGAMGPATPEQAEAVAELELGMALRRSEALRAAGKPAEALAALPPQSASRPRSQQLRLDLERARALRAAGRGEEAIAIYQALLRQDGADRETGMALAATLVERRDLAGARVQIDAALAAQPDDAQALALSSRVAEAEGRLDKALDLERRSLALEDRGEVWRYRRLAELSDAQLAWNFGAIDWLYRSGSEGKGRLSAQELALAWRQGWGAGGRWYVRAAAARVSAGTLAVADDYDTSTFGTLLLCQPNCGFGSVDQLETGLILAAGFERGPWRLDLGTSPIGFPVVNVLGGVAYRGELGPASYTVEASRRAVTSSLLSYSGTVDPNTGRTWGGVVANGVRVNVSRDSGGDYGAWGLAGLYRLTGRNVQDNDKGEVMAGIYRRLVNEGDRLLTVGATGMYWHHSENAGEFTLGHGGYYSPGNYQSLGFPVVYGWRTPVAAFSLRASVSVSWSKTRRAPFYPTDPALQAEAEAIAPATFVDPFYSGGNDGRSYGRSFAAAGERQIAPGAFVGGRIDIERSTNYTPSRFLLYVRFTLDGTPAMPVALPPESLIPGYR